MQDTMNGRLPGKKYPLTGFYVYWFMPGIKQKYRAIEKYSFPVTA
jgi:hypothetical protein